jgi:GrpB-like predicted nucleotidyltransferase (UPF0157 family)
VTVWETCGEMAPADRRTAAAEDLARAGGRNAEVEIVEYDPAWPAAYQAERERLTPHRTHHLHLVDEPGELERRLRFRDRLRADPTLAGEYVALKRALGERYSDDREAYTEAKSEFVKRHTPGSASP